MLTVTIVILCVLVGFVLAQPGISAALRRRRPGGIRRSQAEAKLDHDVYRERRRLRLAELAADPSKQKYAALMEKGGYWSDAQIAYDEDRSLTVTCIHLRDIERAMRLAGIATRTFTESWEKGFVLLPKVAAACRINQPEFAREFPLSGSVKYEEGYQPERHESDNPWARLLCEGCNSSIELVHPEWPRPDTQWFPAGATPAGS